MKRPAMAVGPSALPKMMLGFVVRRCAVAVGHEPSAEEFARWANAQQDGDRTFCLFGRPISVSEARLILRHPGRPVTARNAAPHEQIKDDGEPPVRPASAKVTPFAAAVARLKARGKKKF
jgi:hypothetical protein